MSTYKKPIVLVNEELSEGVYAASGIPGVETETTVPTTNSNPGCDSKYMNGVFAAPNYGWEVTMKEHYGCLGCPAYSFANGGECGLLNHYIDSGIAGSYDTDAGNRMPEWERKGYTDATIVDETTHY